MLQLVDGGGTLSRRQVLVVLNNFKTNAVTCIHCRGTWHKKDFTFHYEFVPSVFRKFVEYL